MSTYRELKPLVLRQTEGLLHVSYLNEGDDRDFGVVGTYDNETTAKYAGVFRDASDSGKFKFFQSLTDNPFDAADIVDTLGANYASAPILVSALDAGNVNINGNTISSLDTDGDVVIDPNGNGNVLLTTTGTGGVTIGGGSGNITFTGTGLVTLNADPTTNLGAATKQYVDNVATGLDIKDSVRVKTNVALPAYTQAGTGEGATLTADVNAALPTIDGVTLVATDRILVTTDGSTSDVHNGIYTVTQVGDGSNPWILTRATDIDSDPEFTAGAFTFVTEGTVNADTGWVCTTNDTITVDTTANNWTQFSAAGVITVSNTAGSGVTLVAGTAPNYTVKTINGIVGTNTTNPVQTVANGDGVTLDIRFDQLKITGTGALDAGSITSNFGAIDNGASTITTTGAITGGTLQTTSSLLTVSTSVLTYGGATGANELVFPTNLAEGLVLRDASVDFVVLDSTTATASVNVQQYAEFGKGVQYKVTDIANADVTADESTMFYTSATTLTANRTVTLPTAAASNSGRVYRIAKTDASAFKLIVSGVVDGVSTTIELVSQHDHVELQSDGVGSWYIF